MQLLKLTKKGDRYEFRIPKRAVGLWVYGLGGGGGGGNCINIGQSGTDTICCGITIARGAQGAAAMYGGKGDQDHFAGGDGGHVQARTHAAPGEQSESFQGGSITVDADSNAYSSSSDGGGGGASSYSAKGAGGDFGGWPNPRPGARPGHNAPGWGAGGGGAYCITWMQGLQDGGGGGAGCKVQSKFIPRALIKNPDKTQSCEIGKGGAGAEVVPGRADPGGKGGDGVIFVFAVFEA